MRRLTDILHEVKISGELARVKKLFKTSFKTFLGGKSRDTKLDFIEDMISDALTKSDQKFLILRLQKNQTRKKKK